MKIGSMLPSVPVQQLVDGEVKQTDLAEYSKGKAVILLGVPGAFTAPCSELHLPGYLNNADQFSAKGVDSIVVLAASDFFAVSAWEVQLSTHPIFKFLADGSLGFTKAAGMELDLTELGLGIRTQRYSALVRDGYIENLEVEPDATAVTVSAAEEMLKAI